jgi:hypothetical protein
MFVHFELWVDEREGIVPRCLIPVTQKKKKSKSTAFAIWSSRKGASTHSIGPNIRIPRTCVSLPFIWFARMITWSIYACIGLLKYKVSERCNNILIRGGGAKKQRTIPRRHHLVLKRRRMWSTRLDGRASLRALLVGHLGLCLHVRTTLRACRNHRVCSWGGDWVSKLCFVFSSGPGRS